MPEFYTLPEAAAVFRTTPWTIRRWIHDPDHPLRGIQVGRRLLVPHDDVRQIIDQKLAEAR